MIVPSRLRASVIAAALGALLLVAACGGNPQSAATPKSSPTPKQVTVRTGNPSSPVTLIEDGSSLILPYLQTLVSPLRQAYPNITLAPAAGGSGKGIADAIAGTVQMGGSDAYLSDAQAQQNPNLLNIPIAVSSQAVNFNLKGVSSLNLTGNVLAQIYSGKITKWNDPAITKLNPGAKLPDQTIVPIRRVDSSGDTFIFTSFLSTTNTAWSNGPAFGTTVTWPAVQGELTASGNPAMVQTCEQTPGSIAYIGISVEATALSGGLGQAALQNRAGKFVKPTQQTALAAVAAKATSIPDDLRASLVYAPGDQSYPIVNYEYVMVSSQQKDANTALALRTFLTWAIDPSGGATSANLSTVGFNPLPATVVPKVHTAINKIQASS